MSGEYTFTGTGIQRGGQTIFRRPAGTTDYGWNKHAEAVCALLNQGAAPQSGGGEWVGWQPRQGERTQGPLAQKKVWVDALLRNGEIIERTPAEVIAWGHDGDDHGYEVVAWRLASQTGDKK